MVRKLYHKLKTKCNDKHVVSDEGIIKCGVPQGSVLGLLLFLIYINDLVDYTESLSRLFADDTSLFVLYLIPKP